MSLLKLTDTNERVLSRERRLGQDLGGIEPIARQRHRIQFALHVGRTVDIRSTEVCTKGRVVTWDELQALIAIAL